MKRDVIFILDGGAGPGPCSVKGTNTDLNCPDPPTGTYEVVDADTNQCYGAVQFCNKHGKLLATGPAA